MLKVHVVVLLLAVRYLQLCDGGCDCDGGIDYHKRWMPYVLKDVLNCLKFVLLRTSWTPRYDIINAANYRTSGFLANILSHLEN